MKYRLLGNNKLKVSSIGLGCMSVSPFYGVPDENESIRTIHEAVEMGINFLDTSDLYGFGHSETLVGKAIKPMRDKVILATKGGLVLDKSNEKPVPKGVNTTPKYIRNALEKSMERLGTDYIDLYYLHRIDPITPIEETMKELVKLINEGKIRHIGLSEATTEQIKEAHSIYPITALQSEYSLWFRDIEKEMLPLCRELGIGFVPFSPLGRGFLTGKIKSVESLKEYDFRKGLPRFSEENINKNYYIICKLEEIAKEKHCTVSQISLAWLLSKGDDIVPIPGISKLSHLKENITATNVVLTQSDIDRLDNICPEGSIMGGQFPDGAVKVFQTFASAD